MRATAVALLCVIAVGTPSPGAAQRRSDGAWTAALQAAPETRGATLAPMLLSAALPGAGQHVLGQRRKWAYLAVEVAAWTVWAERRASAHDYRDRYRDYAWSAARIQSGSRVDGEFEYYETMTKWSRSGSFDADPTVSGVQPEADPGTYNGSIWSLASQIYFPGPPPPPTDPAYQSALAYYQQRAYDTAFLWDWTTGSGEQGELARLIHASDDRFGHATTALGAVIANHLFSAVDAYLSARGRASPAQLSVVPDVAPRSQAGRWLLLLSFGAP